MSPLPIGVRDAVAFARDARGAAAPFGPLLVSGVLAETLARELRAGGDPTMVQTSGDPAHAAALVRIVAGPASSADEDVLRAATRAMTPIVVVQTGDPCARLPYVLPTDVVEVEAGRGFPVERIARVLASALGSRGPALAAALPALRDAVQSRGVVEGALGSAFLAVRGRSSPVLALAQARRLVDLAVAGRAASARDADPRAAAETIAIPLAASVATGMAARALVRRLPVRNPVVDAAVAGAVSLALATVFRRVSRT